jgi:preprotein translocase subunit SecE
LLLLALVVAAVAGFYFLASKVSMCNGASCWLAWLAAAGVFLISEPGRQFVAFARDAWREVKKVVWPTRKETLQMTAYVFAFVVIMALFSVVYGQNPGMGFYDLILGWRKS